MWQAFAIGLFTMADFSPFSPSTSTGLTTKDSDYYLGAPDKIAAEQDSLMMLSKAY